MERHDLLHEFPEHQDKIHQLKTSDAHFRELFDEYDKLEHEIHLINTGEEVVTDEATHEMKARLLFIKDEIFSMLQN
ncbi:hypothetical protein FEDK69T_01720 [Flavobacterium enshiense DK69]|uniref:GTP-binding protein n=1 Tax=Flavobacterium enshiense DK69 TaxID=1107311 RepID=V6SEV2_9FLAO|nr:DUF465 domain-containing protein [Flavobacterium enshiense]ESU25203.1 hypothetical protein FEDK69T_01720 [Flavobacterium enshiense DK69]KGO96902.1 GTP-binding protein [Flavobacterium enshiense DK69]